MEEMDFTLNLEDNQQPVEVVEKPSVKKPKRPEVSTEEKSGLINCLRNEKISVRFIKRDYGFVTNPKHVMFGGLAENAVQIFTVPILTNGAYKNVLTDSEKAFLEHIMGMEPNALSIYNKHDNFWDDFRVRLTKTDTHLDLSVPTDYIKYKVLLANTDTIAESLEKFSTFPKATYKFVLISENDELEANKDAMTLGMEASEIFATFESIQDL